MTKKESVQASVKKGQQGTKGKKGKKAKKNSFFNKVLIFFNIIFVGLLLLSYLAAYISPKDMWYIAFLGLVYPVLLCINLCFIVYWLINSNRFVFVPLIAVAVGFNHITNIIQVDFSKEKYPVAKVVDPSKKNVIGAIKLMSFNVRLFDLYNWTKNIESRSKIFDLLRKESNDIACFQEFYTKDKGELQNVDSILKLQKAYDCHIVYTHTLRKTDHWGIATFSRYPIVGKGIVHFVKGASNICIYSDIKINDDTIRVYNAHLESVRLNYDDYKYIDNLKADKQDKDDFSGAFKIVRRLKKAFVKRATQTDELQEHVNNSPYPVILCGDFNDTPSSYTYHTLSDNLNDAFVESGNGLGSTYYGIYPSFRIDYILHDKRLVSDDFRIIREKVSDHYPITCWIDVSGLNEP